MIFDSSLLRFFLRGTLFVSICLLSLQSVDAQFTLNGSASDLGSGNYLLTPDQRGIAGTIWSNEKISLENSFEVEMDLFFGTKDQNGADGITFSLQPISTSVGGPGNGLGVAGVSPSLITEFDTYANGNLGDPVFDHVAIHKNGSVRHNSQNNLVSPTQILNGVNNVEDGQWYSVKISWDATTQTFSVFVNSSLRINYQGDIVNTIFGGDPNVFWGFTASTGGASNRQAIRSLTSTLIQEQSPLCGADVDYNTWSQHGLLAAGTWTVAPDGSSVTQTVNATPTFYVGNTDFLNVRFTGKIQVTDLNDDDWIGMVFGYNNPNPVAAYPFPADMIVFKWKKTLQTHNGHSIWKWLRVET